MRELWQRLGRLNQVSLIIVAVALLAALGAVVVVTPVAGSIASVGMLALTAFCFWFFFHDEARNNRLRRNGRPAEATIIEVRETGVTVQGTYPLAKLRLRVEPVDGEPYEVITKCLMSRFEIPAYRPGDRISVLIDPGDRDRVAVK